MEKIETLIREGRAKIRTGDAFYNPHMRFCRDVSSCAFKSLEEEFRENVCDGFSASGIRGIRYYLEGGAGKVDFVDANASACGIIRKNCRSNKIKDCKVFKEDVALLLLRNKYDFVELDPFGSPLDFLYPAMRAFRKRGILSVTATDTAVLCGAHRNACIRNYFSHPLRSEYFNEMGIRILLRAIAQYASSYDFGITPLFSLSKRHYFKTFVFVERSAQKAFESAVKCESISHCFNCLHREIGIREACPVCKKKMTRAGPIWIGEIHDLGFLRRMEQSCEELEEINAMGDSKVKETIQRMEKEVGFPPWHFNLHALSSKQKKSSPKIEEFLGKVRKKGFRAERTHFEDNGFKTDAGIKVLRKIV